MAHPGKFIVTGATGYIGRHLIHHLLAEGQKVLALARSRSKAQKLFGDQHSIKMVIGFEELIRELRDSKDWQESCFVHLIGPTGEESDEELWNTIYETTEHILQIAKQTAAQRLIYLSGFGVSEDTDSNYLNAKAASETLITNSGLPYTIFRPSYVLGNDDELTPYLISCMKKGQVDIPGNGKYRIQPIYIDDLMEIIVRAAAESKGNRIIELLGGAITYAEFVALLAKHIATTAKIREVPAEVFLKQAVCDPDPQFSLTELVILILDRVGKPTERCFDIQLRSPQQIVSEIAEYDKCLADQSSK